MKRLSVQVGGAVLLLISVSAGACGQTVIVDGSLSASGDPVKFASISFVNQDDPAKIFTGSTDASGEYQIKITLTSVKPPDNLPTTFELDQNYPNPFSSATFIQYTLNEQSDVDVTIYDVLGRKVRAFSVGVQSTGQHGILWNGKNNTGETVAPGVYFYRLRANGESQTMKMVHMEGNAKFSVPQLSTSPLATERSNKKEAMDTIPGTFSVQIQNTDSTEPHLVSEELDNVTIGSDTTLDFILKPAVNDHHELWVVGYDTSQALALHSTDGGLSWQQAQVIVPPPLPSSTHISFYDVGFADSRNGWIVGDYRHIWHTSDAGTTWQLQFQDPTLGDACTEIAPIDSLKALAATSMGAILRTRDGGQSWQEQRPADGGTITRLVCVDSSVAYSTEGNAILKTQSGGSNWFTVFSDSLCEFSDIQFLNPDTGWTCGEEKQISPGGAWNAFSALTVDGGKTWDFKYLAGVTRLSTIWFFNPDTGITEGGVIYRTTDGGNYWTRQYMDPYRLPSSFTSLKFIDSSTGWGAGTFGTLRKTTDAGVTWTYQIPGYSGCIFTGLSIVK